MIWGFGFGSDSEEDGFNGGKSQPDPLRLICGRGFIRLLLVSAIVWMLLIFAALAFHLWSCHSSIGFLSGKVRVVSHIWQEISCIWQLFFSFTRL